MRLWLLESMERVGYDEYDSFVVRASNEANARKIAEGESGNQYYQSRVNGRFSNLDRSTCVPLTAKGNAEIIIGSFNAG